MYVHDAICIQDYYALFSETNLNKTSAHSLYLPSTHIVVLYWWIVKANKEKLRQFGNIYETLLILFKIVINITKVLQWVAAITVAGEQPNLNDLQYVKCLKKFYDFTF